MKFKLLIIVMAVVLFVNSYDLRVFANTDYDHDRLLEYDGYAEAMYESIVEQTTFISGRYIENKEYVNESINQVKDYAKFWLNEHGKLHDACGGTKIFSTSCLGEMVNTGGAYALTVGDTIKNLFNKLTGQFEPEEPVIDDSVLAPYFYNPQANGDLYINPDYTVTLLTTGPVSRASEFELATMISIRSRNEWGKYSIVGSSVSHEFYGYSVVNNLFRKYYEGDSATVKKIHDDWMALPKGTISSNYNRFVQAGYYLSVNRKDTQEVVWKSPSGDDLVNRFQRINDSVQNNELPQMVVPQLKAYLSCPDGTRINMKINGGTFLDVKGNIMQVDKNGTAIVDSQICNLGWEKPKIQYIDGTDQVGISTPDGGVADAETGETITGGFDDEFDEGCGVICAVGKLLSGLGTIAKAIAAIPLKILDGLLELFKKIIVPPDGFWTKEIEEIEKQFFKDEIKENIDSLKDLGGAGGGQFQDVSVSLMGVDNVTVVDSDSINMSLDTIHGWVRGIFYPLLLFFNISMLYRLIRGSSFVGIGDTKGGGDK